MKNRAFTLIELLVVIAIIGILSAIILSSLNSAKTSAKNARINSDLVQMRNILALSVNNSSSEYTALKVPFPSYSQGNGPYEYVVALNENSPYFDSLDKIISDVGVQNGYNRVAWTLYGAANIDCDQRGLVLNDWYHYPGYTGVCIITKSYGSSNSPNDYVIYMKTNTQSHALHMC